MSESRKKVTAKTVVKGHQETFRVRLITLTVTLIIQKGHHHAVSRSRYTSHATLG